VLLSHGCYIASSQAQVIFSTASPAQHPDGSTLQHAHAHAALLGFDAQQQVLDSQLANPQLRNAFYHSFHMPLGAAAAADSSPLPVGLTSAQG